MSFLLVTVGLLIYACALTWYLPRIAAALDVRSVVTWEMQGMLIPAILDPSPTTWDDLEGLI